MRLPLILAAPPETLIGVAFVVISLISGLVNYLNSRAKPNAPNNRGGGRPVRPRSERIQSEIVQFMREQVRKPDGDAPAQPARREEVRPPQAKALPQRRPTPQQRTPAQRSAPKRPEPVQRQPLRQPINQSEQSSPTIRPGDDISHRKSVASEGLGKALRDHLKSAMVERVQSEAQAYLGHSVSSDANRHLGTFAAGQPQAAAASATEDHAFAAELRSRDGMRKALIASLILERPQALRRGRRS